MSETDAQRAVAAAREAIAGAAQALADAGARDEALARFVPEHRRLGIRRPPRMEALGRVWRLGALLLSAGGELYGTGRVVRAEAPVRRSVLAVAVAEHRALRAAAVRGGYPEGETVDFDAVPIELDVLASVGESGPLVLRDARVRLRWSATQPEALTELVPYLADRVELLVHPPEGA